MNNRKVRRLAISLAMVGLFSSSDIIAGCPQEPCRIYEPTPAYEPTPDIKLNCDDGPSVLYPGDSFIVTIQLNTGDYEGVNAEWWVLLSTPLPPPHNWFHFSPGQGWRPGIDITFEGPIFDISAPLGVLSMTNLPVSGEYEFLFMVDTVRNGIPDYDVLYEDIVDVYAYMEADFIDDSSEIVIP